MKYSKPLDNTLYFSSVYQFPDLDAYEKSLIEGKGDFVYARDGHPNAERLQNSISALEGCKWGYVTSSGMGAISSLVFGLLSTGSKLLAGSRLYGRTLKIFQKSLTKLGIEISLVDECDLYAINKALEPGIDLFFIETITNPTLRVPPIKAISALCKKHECFLAVDNTFASPTICRPMNFGGDFVVESLTKIICGHSDTTMGFVGGNEKGLEVKSALCDFGFNASPFDCHLISRSLETLEIRVGQSCKNALELATWLKKEFPELRVEYPGLPNHPDFTHSKDLLGITPGHLVSVEIPGGREGVNRFLHAATEIPFCPSLGHSTTTCSHSWSTSHRQLEAEEKIQLGITEGLLRFSLGLEPQENIRAAFKKGIRAAGN